MESIFDRYLPASASSPFPVRFSSSMVTLFWKRRSKQGLIIIESIGVVIVLCRCPQYVSPCATRIFIPHWQESNSQPVSFQIGAASTRPQ